MELTVKLLTPYVGGQAKIQNSIRKYMLQGEIESISVDGLTFTITFAWLAQRVGFPDDDVDRWVKPESKNSHYVSNVQTLTLLNLGPDTKRCHRFALMNSENSDLIVLYHRCGDKLSRSQVEGLEQTA